MQREKAYFIFFDKPSNIKLIPFPTPTATSAPTAVIIGLLLADTDLGVSVGADLGRPTGAALGAPVGTDLAATGPTEFGGWIG